MTFSEAYAVLLSLQNISSASPNSHEQALRRVGRVLRLLDHPEKKIPHYIHVTGTSGKGSVCLMIANILQASGKRVGLLTSPHITKITERWQINGRPMPDAIFATYIKRLNNVLNRYSTEFPDELPSYHELLTVLGLWYFGEYGVDYAVVEVGMGGDFDATNIIPHKEIAIITSIGKDHIHLLGPNLTDIARHKAGIITPTTRHAISAVATPRLATIIKQQAHQSKALYHPVDISTTSPTTNDKQATSFDHKNQHYRLTAHGNHQIKNALLALTAADILGVDELAKQQGLAKTQFPLRVELVHEKPYIFIDGAHNHDKIAATTKTIKEFAATLLQKTNKPPNIHLVIGFSKNKDCHKLAELLANLEPTTIATTRFHSHMFRKAALPGELAVLFKRLRPTTTTQPFIDSVEALAWTQKQARPQDIILITGSIFLGGELRPLLVKTAK